jgi:hypothetical protein
MTAMKIKTWWALPALLSIIGFIGCATPAAVVQVSRDTSDATRRVQRAYVADLEAIRRYELAQRKELERFDAEFATALAEVKRVLSESFVHYKAAAEREIMENFDREAFQLLAQGFPLYVAQDPAGLKLRNRVRELEENAKVATVAAELYPEDKEAWAKAHLAGRHYSDAKALADQAWGGAFANLVLRIETARSEIAERAHTNLSVLKLDLEKPKGVDAPAFYDISEVVTNRINEVNNACDAVSAAQGALTSYLEKRGRMHIGPVAEGLLAGFLGLESPKNLEGNAIDFARLTEETLQQYRARFQEAMADVDGKKHPLLGAARTALLGVMNNAPAGIPGRPAGEDDGEQFSAVASNPIRPPTP